MSLLETYKQLLEKIEFERKRVEYSYIYNRHHEDLNIAIVKAESYALACQQILATKDDYGHFINSEQLEAVVELAKQQGHIK